MRALFKFMFKSIIRKLFLVKEIVSKQGDVHFRRYRLIQTPWFAIYIHHILKSDDERHMHDHPWDFESLILSGSYSERWTPSDGDRVYFSHPYLPGDVVKHFATDFHKLTLKSKDVWTLVYTSGRKRIWGYKTENGWVDFQTYRQLKNEGKI